MSDWIMLGVSLSCILTACALPASVPRKPEPNERTEES